MNQGKFVFSQIMDRMPWRRFQTCVDRYHGDYNVQTFKCTDYFRVMAFAQLTYRESLRDIVACLNAVPEKLYHMGIRSGISRNNLSNGICHAGDFADVFSLRKSNKRNNVYADGRPPRTQTT